MKEDTALLAICPSAESTWISENCPHMYKWLIERVGFGSKNRYHKKGHNSVLGK